MEVVIFILVCYGITSIVIYGSIFYPIISRTKGMLNDLLTCPLCFSTWVGFFIGWALLASGFETPIHSYLDIPNLIDIFFCGMLSAGGVWLIENLKG